MVAATENFAIVGRSATLESADGTSINCSSLEEAKVFYKDHPEVKEKKKEETEPPAK